MRVKPKVRVETRETVTAGEVGSKDRDGIKRTRGCARNHNDPFKEPICLMREGEEKEIVVALVGGRRKFVGKVEEARE
jgi:hypothetical protein